MTVKDAKRYAADIGYQTHNLFGVLNTLTSVPEDLAPTLGPKCVAQDLYLFVVVGDGDAVALLLQVVGDRVPKQVGLGYLEAGHHVLLHISGIFQELLQALVEDLEPERDHIQHKSYL